MNKSEDPNRSSGESPLIEIPCRYPLVAVADQRTWAAQFREELRAMGCRKALEEHADAVERAIDWATNEALKDGKRAAFSPTDKEEIKDEVRYQLVRSIMRNYKPDSAANPATYANKAAYYSAQEVVAKAFDRRKAINLYLDAPLPDTKEDSSEQTFADTLPDDAPIGRLSGAARVYEEVDMRLIHDMMTGEEWYVFTCRYHDCASNVQIAQDLGWSKEKFRWFLKKFTRRFSWLLKVEPRESR